MLDGMNIAVYCSAKDSIGEEYLQLGTQLGEWIGRSGHTLVFGGATGGLMSRVSAAVKAHGGKVIGVVPPRIIKAGRLSPDNDRTYKVIDMAARKRKMRQLADVIVCLPGSYGTLDEMYDTIASGTVGEHHKPIIVLNYKGFYDELIALSRKMKQLVFLPQQESYVPQYVETVEEMIEAVKGVRCKV